MLSTKFLFRCTVDVGFFRDSGTSCPLGGRKGNLKGGREEGGGGKKITIQK